MNNDGLTGFATFAFMLACAAAWITSVAVDASNSRIAWVLVDLLAAPIGVIRGFMMWLGAV